MTSTFGRIGIVCKIIIISTELGLPAINHTLFNIFKKGMYAFYNLKFERNGRNGFGIFLSENFYWVLVNRSLFSDYFSIEVMNNQLLFA